MQQIRKEINRQAKEEKNEVENKQAKNKQRKKACEQASKQRE